MPPHTRPPSRPASTRSSTFTVLDTHTGIVHRNVSMTGNKCAPPPENRAAMTRSLGNVTNHYDMIDDDLIGDDLAATHSKSAALAVRRSGVA